MENTALDALLGPLMNSSLLRSAVTRLDVRIRSVFNMSKHKWPVYHAGQAKELASEVRLSQIEYR